MPERDAYDVAVGLLARREHSAQQLRYKLAKRGFDEDAIQLALETCQTLNLQSEARFAEATCRSRVTRGYGPFVIRQLLEQERLSPAIIEQALDELEQSIDWVAEASLVWMKKFRLSDDASDKARQKQWQFLRYRGFDDTTVRAVFQSLEAERND